VAYRIKQWAWLEDEPIELGGARPRSWALGRAVKSLRVVAAVLDARQEELAAVHLT